MRRITLLLLGCLTAHFCGAQDIMSYSGRWTPQAMHVNPSFAPEASTTIGIPVFSSISIEQSNGLFLPSDIFRQSAEGLKFDQAGYLSAIGDNNKMSLTFDVDLLSVGHRFGKNFFRFSIRERGDVFVDLPGDLLRFPVVGNGDFDFNGGVLDFSDLAIGVNQWMEYGFGWQRSLNERTNVGATLKVLFGQQNVRTNRSDVVWRTDLETYAYQFSGGLDINSSGFSPLLDADDATEYEPAQKFLNFTNLGLGVDLGIDHQLNERLNVSASVVDLGFIKWSNEVKNYKTSGEDFIFSGIQITESIISADSAFSDSLEMAIDDVLAELERKYDFQDSDGSYSTGIRSKLNIGMEYEVLNLEKMKGTAGLLFTSTNWNNRWIPSGTLYYRHELGNTLNARLAYTMRGERANGLGAAFTVRAGAVQINLGLDNLNLLSLARIKTDEGDKGFLFPSASRQASVQFGVNLMLGNSKERAQPEGRL